MMKRGFLILGVLFLAVYMVLTALVVVDESTILIVTRFGQPTRLINRAGLVVKWPDPVETAIRLDKRIQAMNSGLGEYLTIDKKNIVVSSFIIWRISDPLKFIESVKDSAMAERHLGDLVVSELGAVIGSYKLSNFLTTEKADHRNMEIMTKVTTVCRKQADVDFGIEIMTIDMRRLGFPKQNLPSVFSRMKTERMRIAQQYRAEGEEEANKIKNRTDKEVRRLLADAYRQAQELRGQGEAEAIKIYGRAFNKDPRFYRLSRTLEAYRKVLDENTTLVLSADSPLFQYLETPPEIESCH